jgi:hypothetical protein
MVNIRPFEKKIISDIQGFERSGRFFYRSNPGKILSGFFVDVAKYGSYVWIYDLPLFERWDHMHFGFGERWNVAGMPGSPTQDLLVQSVLGVVRGDKSPSSSISFNAFFVKYKNIAAVGGKVARCIASAAFLADKKDEARFILGDIISNEKSENEFLNETKFLLELIDRNESEARDLLSRWEAETRVKLSIGTDAST